MECGPLEEAQGEGGIFGNVYEGGVEGERRAGVEKVEYFYVFANTVTIWMTPGKFVFFV